MNTDCVGNAIRQAMVGMRITARVASKDTPAAVWQRKLQQQKIDIAKRAALKQGKR